MFRVDPSGREERILRLGSAKRPAAAFVYIDALRHVYVA
jgi:hypothetical protein